MRVSVLKGVDGRHFCLLELIDRRGTLSCNIMLVLQMSVYASQVWEELGRGLPIPLQGFQCGTQQSMRLGRIHLTTGLESILKRFRLCLLVRVTDSCRRLGLCGNASACTKANSSMASRSSLQPPRLFRSQPPHQTTKPIRFSISHTVDSRT